MERSKQNSEPAWRSALEPEKIDFRTTQVRPQAFHSAKNLFDSQELKATVKPTNALVLEICKILSAANVNNAAKTIADFTGDLPETVSELLEPAADALLGLDEISKELQTATIDDKGETKNFDANEFFEKILKSDAALKKIKAPEVPGPLAGAVKALQTTFAQVAAKIAPAKK